MKLNKTSIALVMFIIVILHINPDYIGADNKMTKSGVLNLKKLIIIEDGKSASQFPLYKPTSISVDSEGSFYVLDSGSDCVVKYDINGMFIKHWGQPGQAPGFLDISIDSVIRINSKDEIHIGERGYNQRISIFNTDGKLLKTFKTEKPVSSISFDKKGNIFTTVRGYSKNDRLIHVYNKDGKIIKRFSKLKVIGKEPLFHQSTIIHDEKDNVYQLFSYFPCLRKFDSNGNLIFEKMYRLNCINKEMDELWKDYNFKKPKNKMGNGWMQLVSEAVYYNGKIYVLIIDIIYELTEQGECVLSYRLDVGLREYLGYFWDIQVFNKTGDFLFTFIGKENVGFALFER